MVLHRQQHNADNHSSSSWHPQPLLLWNWSPNWRGICVLYFGAFEFGSKFVVCILGLFGIHYGFEVVRWWQFVEVHGVCRWWLFQDLGVFCSGCGFSWRWFMETKRSSEENEIMVWASKARRYYLLDRVASE